MTHSPHLMVVISLNCPESVVNATGVIWDCPVAGVTRDASGLGHCRGSVHNQGAPLDMTSSSGYTLANNSRSGRATHLAKMR